VTNPYNAGAWVTQRDAGRELALSLTGPGSPGPPNQAWTGPVTLRRICSSQGEASPLLTPVQFASRYDSRIKEVPDFCCELASWTKRLRPPL